MVCTCPSCPPYSNLQYAMVLKFYGHHFNGQVSLDLSDSPKSYRASQNLKKKQAKRVSGFNQMKQMIHLPLWPSSSLWRAHIAGI